MIFCPKCKKDICYDAKFCPYCGSVIKSESAIRAKNAENTFLYEIKEKFKCLSVINAVECIMALLSVIAISMPLLLFTTNTDSSLYTLVKLLAFKTNFFFGVAKIFGIVSYVAFLAYIALKFVDIREYITLKNYCKKILPAVYYGVLAAVLLFTLIGAIIVENCTLSIFWYIALVLSALGSGLSLSEKIRNYVYFFLKKYKK